MTKWRIKGKKDISFNKAEGNGILCTRDRRVVSGLIILVQGNTCVVFTLCQELSYLTCSNPLKSVTTLQERFYYCFHFIKKETEEFTEVTQKRVAVSVPQE
jgi:hypothetical protein